MDLEPILARSRAAEPFKAAVRSVAANPYGYLHAGGRVSCSRPAPSVKVLRVLTQLLHAQPDIAIERVRVEGTSGCSDFVGTVAAETAHEVWIFDFAWCCRWRAEVEGWHDDFGGPDQIRAAREFGWRCFERWHFRELGELQTLDRVAGAH